jgi:hypothetical protein
LLNEIGRPRPQLFKVLKRSRYLNWYVKLSLSDRAFLFRTGLFKQLLLELVQLKSKAIMLHHESIEFGSTMGRLARSKRFDSTDYLAFGG